MRPQTGNSSIDPARNEQEVKKRAEAETLSAALDAAQAEEGTPATPTRAESTLEDRRPTSIPGANEEHKKLLTPVSTPAPEPETNRSSTAKNILAGVALGTGAASVIFAVMAAASLSVMAKVSAAGAFLALMVTNWPVLLVGGGVLAAVSAIYLIRNSFVSNATSKAERYEDKVQSAPLKSSAPSASQL